MLFYFIFFLSVSVGQAAEFEWLETAPAFAPSGPQNTHLAPIQNIRVKVFPHNGIYSAPQGREKTMTAVQWLSKSECTRTTLTTDGKTSSETLPAGTRTRLSTASLAMSKVFLKCASPIQVIREAGMDSFFYQGEMEASVQNSNLEIINIIPFEHYLKGVVPAEMPSRWHAEALKAQTIAARSYAAFQILGSRRNKSSSRYDVDDTIQFQAYLGSSWHTPSTNAAVEQTEKMILAHQNSPIIAYFSSDSGGYTESAKNIWGDHFDVPYTPAKREMYDLGDIKSDWTDSATLSEIQSNLIARLKLPETLKVAGVRVHTTTESGRAKEIEILTPGRKANPIIIWGEDFRRAMRMRSTLFTVSSTHSDTITFSGRGFGHGVGMNQTGAHILASKLNWTYEQILRFYYEGAEFARME